MSDSIAPTPTVPPAEAPKAKRPRHVINQDYLDEISNSRKVATAATDPAYAPALAAEAFDADLATQALDIISDVEGALARLVGTRADKKVLTSQEATARDNLIAVIQPIQTAARRKFKGDTAKLRTAYSIGGNGLTNSSLADVSAAARTILGRLTPGANNTPPEDTLPGVTAAGRIKALSDAVKLYATADEKQGEKKTEAEGSLETIAGQIAKMAGLRHEIQLAADQAWNWRQPGVATIRKTFLLPPNRPMPL